MNVVDPPCVQARLRTPDFGRPQLGRRDTARLFFPQDNAEEDGGGTRRQVSPTRDEVPQTHALRRQDSHADKLMENAGADRGSAVLEWLMVFFFGCLGTLLRLLLSGEATKPEVAFGSVSAYWSANVLGTWVIAFAVGVRSGPNLWSRTLHRGIVVGFCGGLTTFSSFIWEAVMASKEAASDMLECVILTTCGALGAYYFGWHMAFVTRWALEEKLSSQRSEHCLRVGCAFAVIFSVVCWVLIQICLILTAQKTMLYAGIAGGAGSLLRFLSSVLLNRPGYVFYMGTFCANMSAVLILCLVNVYAEKHVQVIIGSGFCGGLSTLSSLCNDFMVAVFKSLQEERVGILVTAYFYIIFTQIAGGLIVTAFVYGLPLVQVTMES